MDEILWCNHSNETSSAVLSHGTFLKYVAPTFLWCDHSNDISFAVPSHGTIYLVCSSNVWVCGRNPMVLRSNETTSPVFSHGTIYLVCSSTFWVCGWNPMMWPLQMKPLQQDFHMVLFI